MASSGAGENEAHMVVDGPPDSSQKHRSKSEASNRKQNLRRVKPLPFSPDQLKGPTSLKTEEQKLAWCRQTYEGLPKQSAYARHKLKVLTKAISILETDR